ncbi:MAG: MFS transporter [Proteobacteria bacterium]|jgi:MFS family permease|nr:MFS transporter [Pseudomonadota bacterium]
MQKKLMQLIENSKEDSAFISSKAQMDFWLLLVGTFLVFLTVSAVAVFAIIYERNGLRQPLIGVVLSVYGAGTIMAVMLSGNLSRKYGSIRMMHIGLAIMLLSYLSFSYTLNSFSLSIASRLAQGIGYGVFLAPAMVVAKGLLTKKKFVTLFGIYAASIPMPNIIGPALAQMVLDTFDVAWYIPLTSIPMVLGVFIISRIHQNVRKSTGEGQSYSELLKNKKFLYACGLILFVGLFFGFIPNYMATYLSEKHISLSSFFTTFSLSLILVRFLIAPFIEKKGHEVIVGGGIVGISVSYLLMGGDDLTEMLSVAAGIMFGIGYSLCYPRLSTMSIAPFSESERERPVALFNAAFIFGTNFTPLLVGLMREHVGLDAILFSSGGVGLLVGIMLLIKKSG